MALDLLLLLGLTLRTTRLITGDSIPGDWWIKDPLERLETAADNRDSANAPLGKTWLESARAKRMEETGEWQRRWRYLDGLDCPFCVGLWIAGATTLSLLLVGGPGDAAEWWRWVAGAFTLNYLAAHVGSRLGDAGYDEDED